jgi:hypothetical protein
MVLDVTTETGRKIRVVNLYDQQEKGRNTATRPARMANWNNIMNDQTIVSGDFNSHSQRWDPNCRPERDATFWKDWSENFLMQLGNDGQCTREGSNGRKSVIDLTWSSPLESPLRLWRLAKDHEDTRQRGHRSGGVYITVFNRQDADLLIRNGIRAYGQRHQIKPFSRASLTDQCKNCHQHGHLERSCLVEKLINRAGKRQQQKNNGQYKSHKANSSPHASWR